MYLLRHTLYTTVSIKLQRTIGQSLTHAQKPKQTEQHNNDIVCGPMQTARSYNTHIQEYFAAQNFHSLLLVEDTELISPKLKFSMYLIYLANTSLPAITQNSLGYSLQTTHLY